MVFLLPIKLRVISFAKRINMVRIDRATFDEKTVLELIELSKIWAKEGISHGLIPNERDDLKEPCFVAVDHDKIVGYAFGHYYEESRPKGIGEIHNGDRCFSLDELYVLSEYRSQGIGRELFKAIENEIKGKADFISLSTSTKDYRRVLSFYDEVCGMGFHDAFLIKRV